MSNKTVALAVLVVVGIAATAEADPVKLDQSVTTYDCGGRRPPCGDAIVDGQTLAQTFTVGIAGLLTQVDLGIFRSTRATTNDVLLDLLPAAGGLAGTEFDLSGSVSSVSVPISTVPVCSVCADPPFVTAVLPTPVPVQVGDVFAIVLRRPGGSTFPDWVIWSVGADNRGRHTPLDYQGGEEFVFALQRGSPRFLMYGFRRSSRIRLPQHRNQPRFS
jgi:hypothetical protein